MPKKPVPVSEMFAVSHRSHEVLTLKDRVAELEEEIAQLRGSSNNDVDSALLERRIQELTEQLAEKGGVHEIPIEKIHPDPAQPRTIFPQSVIEARAKSLREDGQLTPIILVPLGNGEYKIFEGALRHLAAPLAGMKSLKAVFRIEQEDPIEVFDRQLTTSIQSEKLHGLDLAHALVKLIQSRYPEIEKKEEACSLLNAAIQRLKRAKQLSVLDTLQTLNSEDQQAWLDQAGLRQDEKKVLLVILGKQLNPSSVNTNILPLLKLPPDIQEAMKLGLEASKARELAKLTSQRLNLNEEVAVDLRRKLAQEAIEQQWSNSVLLQKIQATIQAQSSESQPSKLHKAIQRVQSLKIEAEEGVTASDLKLLEAALHEKLKQVRGLLQKKYR